MNKQTSYVFSFFLCIKPICIKYSNNEQFVGQQMPCRKSKVWNTKRVKEKIQF